MRQRAGDDRDFAIGVETQFHALVEDAGIVDVVDDATAAEFADCLACRPARDIAIPVGQVLAFRHRTGVVAGIIGQAGTRLVREGVPSDHIIPAQFGGVYVHLARRLIDEALHDIDSLGAAGAAIGRGWRCVGETRLLFTATAAMS